MKMFDVYPPQRRFDSQGLGQLCLGRPGAALPRYVRRARRHLDSHTHPRYVEALTGQLNKIGFYSNSVIIDNLGVLAERLGKLSGKEDYSLFLVNSGAEANENALKLASFHTGPRQIVAFTGAFHGLTSLAVAATDNPSIVAPVNRTDNVDFLPFNDTAALEAYFAVDGERVAAVIVEGIQA